ncbi:hypothetical protein [Actinokineospora enzanensis]|nr:hypothetical protein [Actinokineospora enzanensis]
MTNTITEEPEPAEVEYGGCDCCCCTGDCWPDDEPTGSDCE